MNWNSRILFVSLAWLTIVSAFQRTYAQQPPPAADPSPPGKRVFVPVEDLQTLIEQDRRWVTLPREEFQQLYAEARRNTLDKPQPPQAIGVRNPQYTGRIVDDQLLISARLEVTKLAAGWQVLPMAFRDLSIEKALIGDQPAKLGREPDGEGRLVLLLDQVGTQTLTLELSRPLVAVGSDKLAVFSLPQLGGAQFKLDVPPQKHLQWNGVAIDRPAANDQPAEYQLAIGGQKQVELRITDRSTEQSSEGLLFANTTLGLRAAPEEVTWQAVTALQVFGKPIDRLQFRVPAELQIISVTSPGLESWEFGPKVPDAPESLLELRYRQSFQEPREVVVKAVLATKLSENWVVPPLKITNVSSHITHLLITAAPGIRVQTEETIGVQRSAAESEGAADKSAVPNVILQGMRFSAWREDFILRLTTQPKARELSAALVTLLDITSSGLDLQSRATIEARYAPLFDVSLALPAEWTVNNVLVNQEPAVWESVPQEAGLHLLRVSFKSPLPEQQAAVIQLTAHLDPQDWPLEEGTATFPLPEVRVLQSNAVEGNVVVTAERDLDVQPQELKGLAPLQLDPALAARMSYEYQDTQYSGKVFVVRKPSRISARTLAFHRLDRETFLSHLEARLTIAGGGTRKLHLSLPESAGTNLRFQLAVGNARIVEQTSGEPAGGRRVWTLLLDQRAYGEVLVLVNVSLPRKSAPEFFPPTLQVVGAERETGQIAFEAESDQQLDLVATDALKIPLADVDPADLPVPMSYTAQERIVAAYGYVLPGYLLKLTERRFARQPVPTAICDRLRLTSILGETGEMQHEASFEFRAVGVQSLQITLPEKAQLWATLLDNAPIEVRHSKSAYLIPLTSVLSADDSANEDVSRIRRLKLLYRTDAGVLTAASQLRQTPPAVTVLNGDGTVQPLEILEQEWTVHHPYQTEFIDAPGAFVTSHNDPRISFLGNLLGSFQVDSPTNLMWKLVTLFITASVIWVVSLIWQHTGGRGLATLCLAVFVGSVFVSLILPAVQSARQSKMAPSIAAVSPPDQVFATPNAPSPADRPLVEAAEEGTPQAAAVETKPDSEVHEKLSEGDANRPKLDSQKDAGLSPKRQWRVTEEKSSRSQVGTAGDKNPFSPPSPVSATPIDPSRHEMAQAGQPAKAGVVGGKQQNMAGAQAPDPFQAQPKPAAMPDAPPAQQAVPVQKPADAAPTAAPAVLSLALNLEPPEGSRSTTFTYSGRMQQSPPELVIDYQNRSRLSFLTLVVEMIVVLMCWFARRMSLASRGLLLALGFGLPLGLMTIVPTSVLPFLDGIFGGTLLGVSLWTVVAICRWMQHHPLWFNTPIVTSAAILVLFSSSSLSLQAADKPQSAPNEKRPAVTENSLDSETIVVPFDAGTDPLKSNRVLLPYDKFMELWRQAHPEDVAQTSSPIAATIAEALYSAELVPAAAGTAAAVKVSGRYVCYSFRKSQVTLPLPVGKVAVSAAQLDGTAAPLVTGTEQNPLAILISQPGLHIVDLQFTIPAQLTGPAGQFQLDLTPVTSGLLRFKVPSPESTFRVNGGSSAFRRVGEAAAAELLIPIAAGGGIQVSWQPQQNRGDVANVVHVESTTAVVFAEAGPRVLSHWNYLVRQGGISEVSFQLSTLLGVRKIEGPDVGGWEVAGEGEAQQLKIFLRRRVEDSTQLKFDLFLKQAADDLETTYAIPEFAPLNITRETGTVTVLTDKQFGVRAGNLSGLTQIEPQLIPLQRLALDTTAQPALGYRFANRPYELELVVNRRQPQLKAVGRHLAQLDQRKVQQRNQFHIKLTGAPRPEVAILLPQGYLLQQVTAPEVANWYIAGREDSSNMDAEALLHLEFAAPRTGEFDVELVGKTLRQSENLKGEISLPYPLETDELDSQLLTTIDPLYTGAATMLDNWKSIDPAPLTSVFPEAAGAASQLGFSSQTPAPAPIPIELHQAQPRLIGQSLTVLSVNEDALDYLFALQWKISSAGADTFVFTTPEWLAGKLDFPEGNGPRRRSVTQEAVGDGRTRWTITLEDAQRERYFVVARAVLPPSEKGEVTAPGFVLEQVVPGQDPPQISSLETQTQFVVVVNQSQTQLTATQPDAVETVPPDDLLRAIKIRQDLIHQAAEIVRVRNPGTPVTWRQQRFQAEMQLPAAVNLAHHVTVLALDGSWREQVTYRIRNRQRQFLAVKLPENSQVLSLFVKGQPARPVVPGGPNGFTLIPLPKTVEGDVSFEVQLVLAGQLSTGALPRQWGLVRQQIAVPIPSVVPPEDSAEYGVPVSQSTWTVYVPNGLDVDILQKNSLTNVNQVTQTLQVLDQSSSMLSDVSELISSNSQSFNRRAKAQSLSNLKILQGQLKSYYDPSIARNSSEFNKQQELQQRAEQLERSIDKLEQQNQAQGLYVQQDQDGNTIVIDKENSQGGQAVRLEQLYFDNGVSQSSAPAVTRQDSVPSAAAKDGKGQQPNVNRDELRGRNLSQVKELAVEQKRKSSGQDDSLIEREEGAAQQPRGFRFQGQSAADGRGGITIGPPKELLRRGEYPKAGTIIGLERQLQFNNNVQQPAQDKIVGGFEVAIGQLNNGQQANGRNLNAAALGMQSSPASWFSSGGLSLLIDIPTDGQVFSFSKVNGGARLSLGVRPHQTWQVLLGLVWTTTWLAVLLVTAWAVTRQNAKSLLLHLLPWFLAALGIVMYFLVRSAPGWTALAMSAFIVGAIVIAFRRPQVT